MPLSEEGRFIRDEDDDNNRTAGRRMKLKLNVDIRVIYNQTKLS